MKISVILPIYKTSKELDKFLGKMKEQKNKNFEIILVIDTIFGNILKTVDAYKTIRKKIKIVYNSKRQGRSASIKSALKIAKGEYSIVLSPGNGIKETFIDNVITEIKNGPADIIEFKASIKAPIKLEGKIRKSFSKPTIIKENPSIIAYTYPFDFNKVIKTSLLKQVTITNGVEPLNSRWTIELVYKIFLYAETYKTVSKVIVESKSKITQSFNPFKILRQWKSVDKIFNENGQYGSEIQYARYLHSIVFLFNFVGVSKNKVLLTKLEKQYEKQMETHFEHFFTSNVYALLNTHESKLIAENKTPSKLIKIAKKV